jgi:phospholipase/lecithinase/hemolysin
MEGDMPYSGVFVFGDSLVDSGNALRLANLYGSLPFTDLPEGAPYPQLGYYQGRFSNGYTFADYLSNKYAGAVTKSVFPYHFDDPWLGLPIDPFAPDPSGNNLNFAYGGAQIRQGSEVVPDLDGQTDAFKDAVDGHPDPNALYLFTIGSNDVRSLVPVNGDPVQIDQAHAALDAAAHTLLTELQGLAGKGVQNVLITGIADVGLIPKYDLDGNHVLEGAELARSQAGTLYSQYLDNLIRTQVLPALQSLGLNVTYVPLMDYDSGGSHVTGALDAILPELAATNGLTVVDLSQHLLDHQNVVFFDQIHPDAQTHALMAAYANAHLTGQAWIETTPLVGADVDYRATGSIGAAGETDKLVIAMVPATTYTFQMLGVSSLTGYTLGQLGLGTLGQPGTLLGDSAMKLMSSGGSVVASDDDSGLGLDSVLSFTNSAAGNYTLALNGVGSLTGTYVMTATVTGAAMQAGNTYTVNNSSTLVVEGAGGIGEDVVLASVNYALTAGSEIEVLRTTNANGKSAIALTGNEFAQTIVGNAGANVIEGKGGADTLYGGKGSDSFVLSSDALLGAGNIDHIMDYAAGEIVDVRNLLSVGAGTNVVAGGFLRVTSSGLIQVDLDGGANNWATLSTVNGTSAVTVRYLSGGAVASVVVGRTADSSAVLTSSAQQLADHSLDTFHGKAQPSFHPMTLLSHEDWDGALRIPGDEHGFGVNDAGILPFC